MVSIKRLWIWCRRIRHSAGFGVQSPTDFFLITSVMYEKSPYYAYQTLSQEHFDPLLPHYRTKVNRLLFRMVNYTQPHNLLEVGRDNGAAFKYMCTAKRDMQTCSIKSHEQQITIRQLQEKLDEWKSLDCLHIGHTLYYKAIYEKAVPHMNPGSWMIVGGIHATKNREAWWKQLQQDERTAITYDLYDIGFVFFDKKRYKENYIVNFL